MANNQGDRKRGTDNAVPLTPETAKGLSKMATEILAIANGKTWKVTGRSFVGRDGQTYSAGMEAPKTNVNLFGWKLASDLFTVADAQALISRSRILPETVNALADAMTASKSLVTYLNHETRHAVAIALSADPTADVAALIESARPAKPATPKRDDEDPLAGLMAL